MAEDTPRNGAGGGWGGPAQARLPRASPGSGTKDGDALRASLLGTCSMCARPVLGPPLRPREPWALPVTLLSLESQSLQGL